MKNTEFRQLSNVKKKEKKSQGLFLTNLFHKSICLLFSPMSFQHFSLILCLWASTSQCCHGQLSMDVNFSVTNDLKQSIGTHPTIQQHTRKRLGSIQLLWQLKKEIEWTAWVIPPPFLHLSN